MIINLSKEQDRPLAPSLRSRWAALVRWYVGEVPYVVAKSIRENPQDWSKSDNFRMMHKSQVEIWIANRDYGIEVTEYENNRRRKIYGDYGQDSTSRGKSHIWAAASTWLKERQDNDKRMRNEKFHAKFN